MCAVEMLLQCNRTRLTRCRCIIGGGCTGQMALEQSSLLEKVDSLLHCPPSPQPASFEVLKGGFFVERGAKIKAGWFILGQVASRLAASKTKRRKTSSAYTQVATVGNRDEELDS